MERKNRATNDSVWGAESTDSSRTFREHCIFSSLSFDTVFEVLADRRRRFALYGLTETTDDVIELADLASRVATLEAHATDRQVPPDHRERVAAALAHQHLPKLVEAGIVEYDDRSSAVRYRGQPVVEEYCQHVAAVELSDVQT